MLTVHKSPPLLGPTVLVPLCSRRSRFDGSAPASALVRYRTKTIALCSASSRTRPHPSRHLFLGCAASHRPPWDRPGNPWLEMWFGSKYSQNAPFRESPAPWSYQARRGSCCGGIVLATRFVSGTPPPAAVVFEHGFARSATHVGVVEALVHPLTSVPVFWAVPPGLRFSFGPFRIVGQCHLSATQQAKADRDQEHAVFDRWRAGVIASALYRPCLWLPLRGPLGPPDPGAPPCIRQRRLPVTMGDRQGVPERVLAPKRGREPQAGCLAR
jgi:hypothetical protein